MLFMFNTTFKQQFIRHINEKYQTNKHKKSNILLF